MGNTESNYLQLGEVLRASMIIGGLDGMGSGGGQTMAAVRSYWNKVERYKKSNHSKLMLSKGLTWFPEYHVWALNRKNAIRKFKAKTEKPAL